MKNTSNGKKNLLKSEIAGKIALSLVSFVLAIFIFCYEQSPRQGVVLFPAGEPATRNVFSPFDISFVDEKSTAADREAAGREVPDVYEIDTKFNQKVYLNLNELFESLKQSKASPSRPKFFK